MRRVASFAAGLFVAVGLWVPDTLAIAETASQTAENVLADSAYQTTLPKPLAIPPLKTKRLPPPEFPEFPAEDPRPPEQGSSGAEALTMLMWLLCATALFLIVAWAIGRFSYNQRAPRTAAAHDDEEPLARPPGGIDVADALAERGAHAEALHALLLRAIEDIREQLSPQLGAALTSREIVDRADFGAKALSNLSSLVRAVEISWFGGRTPSAEDYQASRNSYLQFNAEIGNSRP